MIPLVHWIISLSYSPLQTQNIFSFKVVCFFFFQFVLMLNGKLENCCWVRQEITCFLILFSSRSVSRDWGRNLMTQQKQWQTVHIDGSFWTVQSWNGKPMTRAHLPRCRIWAMSFSSFSKWETRCLFKTDWNPLIFEFIHCFFIISCHDTSMVLSLRSSFPSMSSLSFKLRDCLETFIQTVIWSFWAVVTFGLSLSWIFNCSIRICSRN